MIRRLLFRLYDSIHRQVWDATGSAISGEFILNMKKAPAVREPDLPPLYPPSKYGKCAGCGVLVKGVRHKCVAKVTDSKIISMPQHRRK